MTPQQRLDAIRQIEASGYPVRTVIWFCRIALAAFALELAMLAIYQRFLP